MHVTPQHFEIPTDDLDRAARFYRQAFGWEIHRLAWEGAPYCTVRMPEGTPPDRPMGGGLMARGDLGAGQPLLVLHVEGGSLESCLERIVAAGGRVEQPPEAVGEMGRFARFRDSEGNLLGLWQAL